MKAGPETDLAVAKCLDVPARISKGECWIGYNFLTGEGASGAERTITPSTDLNDAFLAAEKFGLFRIPYQASLQRMGDGWSLSTFGYVNGVAGDWHCGGGDTPCLAICEAILKLASEKK